jgi:hypothetical protein
LAAPGHSQQSTTAAALDGRTGANSDVSCAIFASANLSYTERMTFGKLALREN